MRHARFFIISVLCASCLFITACAGKNADTPTAHSNAQETSASRHTSPVPAAADTIAPHANVVQQSISDLDDYDTTPVKMIADPFEPWNRFWFQFNDIFYLYIARPMHRGYDFVMPREFQSGLKNFLANVLFPVRFVNALLQGKPMAAGAEFGRFIVNTFVGFGGFIDVAKGRKTVVPLDPVGEDFAQTLGYWGVGQGFYLVWPIIGPSTARETVGLAGDLALSPTMYFESSAALIGVNAGLRFNALGGTLRTYEELKGLAVDPYIAMREAYVTLRQRHVEK